MLQLLPINSLLVEVTLITKMLGIRFWEVYQNLLIQTIIIQTAITIAITIAITTITEIIIIIATTIITVIVTIITVIITIILPTEVTTLRQIDYSANLSI